MAFVIFIASILTPGALLGAGIGFEDLYAGDITIVIDPGHGGEDTGAVGSNGTEEKNITLSLGLMLKEILKERMGCNVLLTRTEDVFIPLDERTAFANRAGADLFISIHANAAVSREAMGVETFFLSFDATDDDARRIAAFENKVIRVSGSQTPEADDLNLILLDLANTEAHHESSRLAEAVHLSMLKATGKENRGVKQAPFAVLAGATMPAVLVETGFISNPHEEKWLSSKKEQARIAEAIAEGVAGFKKTNGKVIEYSGFREHTKKN
ncbi:MAG: N-acetylmuramoyl-L-alanine amidase [Deltaproteobacteria bacterium]|nr:N-acetylmuramoyl-L-alanine amidase [Deltaproteobacteria bacterium]